MKSGFETEGHEVVSAFPEQVKGKTFLITGASPGGLGAETAVSLARGSPAIIILVGRSLEKCQQTIDRIRAIDASITVKFVVADLSSLASIRAAAESILGDADISQIDVIINNAAIMACPFARSPDGLELQLASNHLGHFVLTNKVRPKLSPAGTVVCVSSVAHKYDGVRFTDPNFLEPDSYTPYAAYGQSKTAVVLFAVALNRRGVRAFAVNPGSIRTNLQTWLTPEITADAVQKIFPAGGRERVKAKTLQQGCATQLRAALDPSLDPRDGVYLNDCEATDDEFWVSAYALDSAAAERCWKLTEDLVDEEF